MIGNNLEKLGWRQGSIIRASDITRLEVPNRKIYDDTQHLMIVASQSCDIANNDIDSEPFIELSVAIIVENLNGNYTFNKNPRILHTTLQVRAEAPNISDQIHIELKAFEKFPIRKQLFDTLTPDPNRLLVNKHLDGYISWLAARYSRPDLPTEFNNRINSVDPKKKRKTSAKSADKELSGIYVEITPDAEITKDQKYRVNLLGLVSADFNGSTDKATDLIDHYARIMEKANMDVTKNVLREDEVSLAVIKKFKRFYYDDLSLKNDTPSPPETKL